MSEDFRLLHLPHEGELPPGLLYHYTTPEGLIGIISSGSIRATHVRYLNDVTELRNAFEGKYPQVLIESLGLLKQKETVAHWFREVVDPDEDYAAYLASFTDDETVLPSGDILPGDRLSQWRAYCSDSGGFSLGLDYKALLNEWNKGRPKGAGGLIRGIRCVYREEDKAGRIEEILNLRDEYFSRYCAEGRRLLFEKEHRDPSPKEVKEIEDRAARKTVLASFAHFLVSAATFKDKAFLEENEWRFVFFVRREKLLKSPLDDPKSPIIKFRQGKFGLTPFIEFPNALNALRRIVVGPTPHRDEAESAVRLLLESVGMKLKTGGAPEGVEVVCSKIPYRNW